MGRKLDKDKIIKMQKAIIADLIEKSVESIDIETDFYDLGLTSITIVDFIELLNERLKFNIGVESVFDCHGIGELTVFILEKYNGNEEVNELEDSKENNQDIKKSEIAIIGIYGKFGECENLEQFWKELMGENIFNQREVNNSEHGRDVIGGKLKNRDCFDAAFFDISSDEADKIDPQQRVFMQAAYNAFEDAGYPAENLSGEKVGIFIGGRSSDYKDNIQKDNWDYSVFLGNETSSIPSRFSYTYNFKGPSICLDAACSSSITSLHYACQSLQSGESNLALAGGVYVDTQLNYYNMAKKSGMLSQQGVCKSLDQKADGMTLSEGVGVVVLKRLADAIRDKDYVYTVIKGSAVVQSGRTNGFGIPSMNSQKELLDKAYKSADIELDTIAYIEANGTATKLGDSIELNALKDFFENSSEGKNKCAIGTSKTSVGHAVMASGMSGLFKILLSFQNKVLPPTSGFNKINENVDLTKSPFYIPHKPIPFTGSKDAPLRAAINSFGLNGTNAHMILEEGVNSTDTSISDEKKAYYLFPVSAKTETALVKKLDELCSWLYENKENYSPMHVSNVLFMQRSHFAVRCSFIAKNLEELYQQIVQNRDIASKIRTVSKKMVVNNKLKEKLQKLWGNIDKDIKESEYKICLESLQNIYLQGYPVKWDKLFVGEKYTPIHFMLYPFDEKKHWIIKKVNGNILYEDIPEKSGDILFVYPEKIPSVLEQVEEDTFFPVIDMEHIRENRGLQMNGFEDIICKILFYQLSSIGFFSKERFSLKEMKEIVSSNYIQWLEESLRVLIQKGYLKEVDTFLSVSQYPDIEEADIWKAWVEMKMEQDVKPQVKLLESVLKSLADILTKKILATDVMFPNSSFDLIADIYKNNKVADYFNEVLADSIASTIEKRIELGVEEPIRILEIGAGTGGTSSLVLNKLKPYHKYIEEYCYTDVSKAFLIYGEKEFSHEHPFMSFKIFDVEETTSAFEVGINSYDFVLASNVLHATRNILHVLSNVKVILKKNGILYINELSSKSLFTHVTFGMLDGWWLPEDRELRVKGSPAILPEVWAKILKDTGYEKVFFPANEAHELGQQIIVSESNGLVSINEEISCLKKEQTSKKAVEEVAVENFNNVYGNDEEVGVSFVKNILCEKAAKDLSVCKSEISDIVPLRELGIDSILGSALIEEVNIIFGTSLNTTILFDYITIEQLSDYIFNNYTDNVLQVIGNSSSVNLIFNKELSSEKMEEEKCICKGKQPDFQKDEIAIIGFSGRFGNCDTLEEFWDILKNGEETVTSTVRWDVNLFDNKESYEKTSLLNNIAEFDPLFFNISGREAIYMDPQQRIFLEEAWKSMEHAGYCGYKCNGLYCGVYVACGHSDYINSYHAELPGQVFWGNLTSVIAARIAYYLNLKGPAVTIDTACSSSLVAIHMACQGLWCGEIDMALAGGVSVQCSPNLIMSEERVGMLSPDAKCYTFDERANGFAYGEGAGAVILKRLKDAVRDGDTIYGVIKGSGINQDGTTNGLTAPSAKSQEKLIRDVYENFGIHPSKIQMFEAHGTGTKLGDPIEFQAATKAFQGYTDRNKYCAIGSVKTNIGHTQYAAGIASVIKVLLSLQNKQIPASINFENGNSNIDFDNTPFYVNTQTNEWKCKDGEVRQAAISSFGASGTNAHLVIAESLEIVPQHQIKEGYMFVLSAQTNDQVKTQVEQLINYLHNSKETDCGNMSYTLIEGRKHFKYRLACVGTDKENICEKLKGWMNEEKQTEGVYTGEQVQQKASVRKQGEDVISLCMKGTDYIKNLKKVAEYFVEGYDLPYEKLFEDGKYGRIPMPTYPFAKEHYWMRETGVEEKVVVDGVKCFTEEWVEENAVLGEIEPQVLVFMVTNDIHQKKLERVLREKSPNIELIFVKQKGTDKLEYGNQFTIDRNDKEEYIELFVQLKKKYEKISGIVYMWSMEEETSISDYIIMAYIVQALNKTGLSVEQFLYTGIYRDDLSASILDAAGGFALSLRPLMPQLKLCMVCEDCRNKDEDVDWEKWAEKVWTEVCCNEKRAVLYRDEKRLTTRIKESELEAGKSLFKEGGVYFITGGAGKLLIQLEKEMAKVYHANFILMGRSTINNRIESCIQELEQLGGHAIYIQGDVSSKSDVRKALKVAKETFGIINGVIHGAGVQGEGTIFDKTKESMMEVLAPKITGTLVLEEVFNEEELDFYCYVSSISAIAGDFGGCDYAVANRFLMSYARCKNEEQGIRRVAIEWPMWKDGSMGIADEEGRRMYLATNGLRELKIDEGINLWKQLLEMRSQMHHIVLAGNAHSVDAIAEKAGYLGKIKGNGNVKKKLGETIEMNRRIADCRWKLTVELKEMAAQLLDIPFQRMDNTSNIGDFGFDSLSLADFAKQIQEKYEIPFTPSIFYSYATIEKLAIYLSEEFGEKLCDGQWAINNGTKDVVCDDIHKQDENIEGQRKESIAYNEEPIAIIGMSGRFPNARTTDELWDILERGKSVIGTAPEDRFLGERHQISKWKCGWISGAGEFEPLFFEISPKEAEMMDPRHRLLMQETWKALEDAGYSNKKLNEEIVGMFIGAESGDYSRYNNEAEMPVTSDHEAVLSARLAYFMDFTGPNMTINTACSSGLVAMHQACQSLRNGECDTAIAGGVNLILSTKTLERIQRAGMISESDVCYAFDRRADGMVPAEAVVAIVLKPLSKAERDGNPIYALVRGSGVNYDGKTNGITSPSGLSQQKLIEGVYARYHINPEDVSYVSAHGTGTRLGDPIEVNALYDAYRKFTKKENYCALTSIKTNLGHTFAASGLVGVVSLVKGMEHGKIPASLNFEEKNDYIKWDNSPFYVVTNIKDWTVEEGKRRLGAVSAFGMSGTNAHMVIEEYKNEKKAPVTNVPVLLLLSAKKEEALKEKVRELRIFIKESKEDLIDISNTLLEGRTHFNYRCAFVAESKDEAIELLGEFEHQQDNSNIYHGKVNDGLKANSITENFIQELIDKIQGGLERNYKYKDSLLALANLYCIGFTFTQINRTNEHKLVHLPTYPFERTSYWLKKEESEENTEKAKVRENVKEVIEIPQYIETNQEMESDIEEIKQELLKSIAEALYIQPHEVYEKTKFIELGLDSIVGVEWIKTVNAKYGLNISATKIYDYPSIDKFAPYVHALLVNKEAKEIVPHMSKTVEEKEISSKEIEDELLISLQKALYVDLEEGDKKKNFIELGLDSIIGIEWIKEVNKTYNLNIQASKMYDYPNVKKFANMITKKLKLEQTKKQEEKQVPINKVPESKIVLEVNEELEDKVLLKRNNKFENEDINISEKEAVVKIESEAQDVKVWTPEMLGDPLYQERYHCKWNYYSGSMAHGVASVKLVKRMAEASLLSILGSGGYSKHDLVNIIVELQANIKDGMPYGTCFIANLNNEEKEKEQAELFIQFGIPVIEVAACSYISKNLVYLRLKGVRFDEKKNEIIFPRRLIGKCSRIEVANQFMSPPPEKFVKQLLVEGLITEEEARLAQRISMTDDVAVEADSGGHTNQGVMTSIVPPIIDLRDRLQEKYQYQEQIMIGCGGGIGSPEAVASTFALGADFIFTGSINQCTVESGASPVIKDILSDIGVNDTGYTIAGDMFEIGAKIQVVKRKSKFIQRANKLYQLFMQYDSLDEVPYEQKQEIESDYFKKSFSQVWDEIKEHKQRSNPADLLEAETNSRFKMALFIKWYSAHCNRITLEGKTEESDNFEIFCGPAMGAFNNFVKGTKFERWQNRHVDEIANLIMEKACNYMMKKGYIMNPIKLSSIAVVGMSGNFPKAENIDEFWNNLITGRDCVSTIPEYRWDQKKYYNTNPENKGTYICNRMGVLDDIDKFDAELFKIPPVEAIAMDPQQRIFLQNCWSCIEDAGIKPSRMEQKRCAVYVGCGSSGYKSMVDEKDLDSKVLTGNVSSTLAARISYFLDLKGASISIETACSSSLVAIAQACDSLVLHNCDYALAGGTGILAEPSLLIMSSKAGMLSEDGKCYTFDQRANGFVPGEGVGVVMLKRLEDAVRDKDRIYGVIKGWGVNQDGKTNGITAPSVISQTQLERDVYKKFYINPEHISYVEAHGTGTKLGDPIEVEALTESFRTFTQKENYCAIGSVKSNIGHLMAAAGVASVIKVLLSMQHKMIPPTINYNTLNEHIDMKNSPFYVAKKAQKWETEQGIPRCAAVSSFGFSGTNCHIVIEEYKQNNINKDELKGYGLFILSAQNQQQLKHYANMMLQYLKEEKDTCFNNILYTLQTAREELEEKLAIIVDNKEDLIRKLDDFVEGKNNDRLQSVISLESDDIKEQREIAERWFKDSDIDWPSYYSEDKVRLVSLPRYPFVKKTYWIGQSKKSVKVQPAGNEQLTQKLELNQIVSFQEKRENTLELISMDNSTEVMNANVDTSDQLVLEPCGTNKNYEPVILEQNVLESFDTRQDNSSILDTLTESLANVLFEKKSNISITKEFIDMGVDSILGIEWIKNLNKIFNYTFNATMLYEYTTIQELGKYISQVCETKEMVNTEEERTGEELQDQNTLHILIYTLAECMYMTPDEVNISKNFIQMGLDSILGIEWIRTIKKKYKWDIDITALYDYPTIQELASYIDSTIVGKTENKVDEKLDLDQLLEKVYEGKLSLSDAEGCLHRINLDTI